MKAKKKLILMNMIMMAFGALAGFIIAVYIDKQNLSFLQAVYAFIWLIAGYMAGIIIHESGHLVTGLYSGYEFLSFRIGSLTFIKENGRLTRKKFSLAGTGGQCLMMPPESDTPEDVPFVLYFLGGGLFNLITAVIFIPAGLLIPGFYLSVPFLMLGFTSAIQCLMNLIPMNLQCPNDGFNIVFYSRNKAERVVLYKQLRINGLLHKGYEPSAIPGELFDFGENSKGLGDLLKASLCIDNKDFPAAQKLIEKAIASGELLSVYEYEAKAELLFCKVMNGAPGQEIDELYDKTLKNYISASSKTQIAKRRIMYAYYLIYKQDMAAAEKEYNAALAMKETYPIAGEVKSEISIIEYIRSFGAER